MVLAVPAEELPPRRPVPETPRVLGSLRDWASKPHGAGVYRIYFNATVDRPEAVYIGRTSDFRDRPRHHNTILRNTDRTQQWAGPVGVNRIELIYAKRGGNRTVCDSVDLDDMEEIHIARAQKRHENGDRPLVLGLLVTNVSPEENGGRGRCTKGDPQPDAQPSPQD